jgi:guanylate kinase
MPELKNIEQFRQVLATYHTSDRAHSVLQDLRLILLIAPTAGGRNTIIQRLMMTGRYYFIISDTTRPPRKNDGVMEQNGKEYWFRSEDQILADLEGGEFLEAEILHNQQVSGISIRELEKAKDQDKTAVTDVDLEGVHSGDDPTTEF